MIPAHLGQDTTLGPGSDYYCLISNLESTIGLCRVSGKRGIGSKTRGQGTNATRLSQLQ